MSDNNVETRWRASKTRPTVEVGKSRFYVSEVRWQNSILLIESHSKSFVAFRMWEVLHGLLLQTRRPRLLLLTTNIQGIFEHRSGRRHRCLLWATGTAAISCAFLPQQQGRREDLSSILPRWLGYRDNARSLPRSTIAKMCKLTPQRSVTQVTTNLGLHIVQRVRWVDSKAYQQHMCLGICQRSQPLVIFLACCIPQCQLHGTPVYSAVGDVVLKYRRHLVESETCCCMKGEMPAHRFEGRRILT